MPRLSSGRQFGLSADHLFSAIQDGCDRQRSHAMMTVRIHIPDARALCNKLTVGYYATDDSVPPQGECHSSGLTVGGVLAGKAGWSDEELAEFAQWLATDTAQAWMQDTWEQLDVAIRHNPVWLSSLWQDD